MSCETVCFFIFVTFLIFLMLYSDNAIYIKSDVTNKYYYVDNKKDKKQAANVLGKIDSNIQQICNYLRNNRNEYPQYEKYIDLLLKNIKHTIIFENAPTNKYTSYTINKGYKIGLCIRYKDTKELHDINILMYVAVHELAHIACPEVGHTKLFMEIFTFLLSIAVIVNVYTYDKTPQQYCGIPIHYR